MPARAPSKTIDGRTLVLNRLDERDWQRQVLTWAKRAGWLCWHVHDSRYQEWGTDAGMPDLVLCHPVAHRLIVVELKTQKGRVTPMQTRWLDALSACMGIEVAVWRPNQEREVRATLGMAA